MSSVDGQFQATEIGNHNVLIRLWGNAQTGGFDWFWFSGGMFSNNHWMDCRGQFTLTIYRQDPITSDSMSIQSIHNYIIQVYQVCMYHHVSKNIQIHKLWFFPVLPYSLWAYQKLSTKATSGPTAMTSQWHLPCGRILGSCHEYPRQEHGS
jgi:hypothetical protein